MQHAMNFDESFFEEGVDEAAGNERWTKPPRASRSSPYTAKTCYPEWFNMADASCREEDHVIFKYRADLCYLRRQFTEAAADYQKVLEALPPTNATVHREVTDSLARCYLETDKPREALHFAAQLVTPPHHNDASSWQLLAQCHKSLGQIEDYVICSQQSNLLQRYDTSQWLLLSEAFISLSVAENDYCNASSAISSDCAKSSNTDDESLKTILSNTVILFRPYYNWRTDSGNGTRNSELQTVWELLGRSVSVETFLLDLYQLPREHHHKLLEVLFQVSSCCCLIWAKQLQLYSVRHSSSFCRQIQSDRLSHIEHLIGCCRDDLVHRLTECFNHPTIFEENLLDEEH